MNRSFPRRLAERLDLVSEWSGRLVAWLTLSMVLVTFVIVVLRYAFDLGWIALQESVTYQHALVFLLGAAYTFKHQGHVRVDIFYQRLSPCGRAWVDLLGDLVLMLPVTGFIFWSSWDYVGMSWGQHESSQEAGGLPGVYLLKTTILLMAVLLLVQGIADVLRQWSIISGNGND